MGHALSTSVQSTMRPLRGRPQRRRGDAFDRITRQILGLYLGREAEQIRATDRLSEELDMRLIDVALVTMRLEDIARTRFPSASVHVVRTVRDLAGVFRTATDGRHIAGSTAALTGRSRPDIPTRRSRARRRT